MPQASPRHQAALARLIEIILPAVRQSGARWFPARTCVFLPNEKMVQPDLVVFFPGGCASVSERGIEGAPDLLIEILSLSNPEHDRKNKRRWYAEAAVREYWIVSPEAAIVEVLVLNEGEYGIHQRAAEEEVISSRVLPELRFPAAMVFDDEGHH